MNIYIWIYIPRSSYLSLFLPLPRWLVISAAKSAETTRNAAGIGHGQQLCSHLVLKIFWGPGFQSANASEVLSFVHSIPFAKTLNCDLCFHFICFQHIPLHVSCWYSSALSWDLPYEIFAHTVIEDGRVEFVFSPLIQRVLTFFSVVHPSVQLWHLSKEAVVFFEAVMSEVSVSTSKFLHCPFQVRNTWGSKPDSMTMDPLPKRQATFGTSNNPA